MNDGFNLLGSHVVIDDESLRMDGETDMVIVMDMATGKRQTMSKETAVCEEFGAYCDEVLNAGWLPLAEMRLETRAAGDAMAVTGIEPDEFLRNLYRCQE